MKRFLSLLVALVLLVSMFALPTFALAQDLSDGDGDDTVEARKVELDLAAFETYIADLNKGLYVQMGNHFKLNYKTGDDDDSPEWINDITIIRELFPDIEYYILPDERTDFEENEQEYTVTYLDNYPEQDDVSDPEATAAAEDEDDTDAITDKYHRGQHVTLKAANTFAAPSDYEFVGWLVKITYDGKESVDELLYRAGDKFVMPEGNVEVKAYWYKIDTDDDTTDDDTTEPSQPAEPAEPKLEYSYTNDIICIEYITPSDDPKDTDDWKRVSIDTEIKLNTSGWWMFRLVVVDGVNGDLKDKDAVLTHYNTDEFYAQDGILSEDGKTFHWEKFCLYRYAVDTDHPEVALSDSMINKMEDGLEVGKDYQVLTSLSIEDPSGTSITYKVYRHSGKGTSDKTSTDGWVLIYDSTATEKVLEAGKDYITSAGVIKPKDDDVTENVNTYRYKIEYSVKDNNGYFGVEKDSDSKAEFHPTLFLGVKLSIEDKKEQERIAAWKIVLFVIAGLAAVGIVVLLCIKPKEAVAGDSRVSEIAANGETDNGTVDEPTAESPNDAE